MRSEVGHLSNPASGRPCSFLIPQTPRASVMAILRRTPRAVYRVYSQDDYLAGSDQLNSWDPLPGAGVSRERMLRRLAGAAVLTGAVGAAAGVIVLAGIRGRSTGSAGRCEPLAADPSRAAVRKPEQLDTRPPPGADPPGGNGSSRHRRKTIGRGPSKGHPPAFALRGTSESHPARICLREGLRTERTPRGCGQAAGPERVRVRALRWTRKAPGRNRQA